MHILLVEDDDRVAAALRPALHRHGMTTTRLSRGRGVTRHLAGVDAAGLDHPDLGDQAGNVVVAHEQKVHRQRLAVAEQLVAALAPAQAAGRQQAACGFGQAATFLDGDAQAVARGGRLGSTHGEVSFEYGVRRGQSGACGTGNGVIAFLLCSQFRCIHRFQFHSRPPSPQKTESEKKLNSSHSLLFHKVSPIW